MLVDGRRVCIEPKSEEHVEGQTRQSATRESAGDRHHREVKPAVVIVKRVTTP